MRSRPISAPQARAVLAILKEECGYTADPFNGEGFVRAITTEGKTAQGICEEYRFMGALGFGGKFRNNGNRENIPHVDCYPEDTTPDRLTMMGNANRRLTDLFNAEADASNEGKGTAPAVEP